MTPSTHSRFKSAAALLLAALAGCGNSAGKSGAQAAPVEVGVVVLAPTAVTLTKELPGRT